MTDSNRIEELKRQKMDEIRANAGEAASSEPADAPVEIDSEADFEALLDGEAPVLVDFYADWCGPCQMLKPTVKRLAAETNATVATVDVDARQGLATRYGVRGVPTLLIFADGEPVERVVGVRGFDELASLLEGYGA
jgi:thioredoxin 1